jgi:hypothetical protein
LHVSTLMPSYPSASDVPQGCSVAEPLDWLAKSGAQYHLSGAARVAPEWQLQCSRSMDSLSLSSWRLGRPNCRTFLFARIIGRLRELTFGHFVPLTPHSDYSVARAGIGIPGISKLYDAHITNLRHIPRRIERCEFLTDAFASSVGVGYRL